MKRIIRAWRRRGSAHALRVMRDRIVDRWRERQLRIDTAGLVLIESLLPDWTDCHDYYPTTIQDFHCLIRDIGVAADDVFLDYGSGKGRVLVLAAQYPFRRIVGVEISEQLNASARVNLALSIERSVCKEVSIWWGNAQDYRVPPDVTVIYLYNPFHGETLRKVLTRILDSLRARPRRLRVIVNNPVHLKAIEADYPWLVPVKEYAFEYQSVVYEARADIFPP